MLRDFFVLSRVKAKLAQQTMPPTQAFVYFLIITGVDALQLAVLQVVPAQPTPWTPIAVWGSFFLGFGFLIACFWFNGGAEGHDFFVRYFSLSGLVALPFQALLGLPAVVHPLAGVEWYNPAVVLCANVLIFGFIAAQIRSVARM